MIKDLNVLWDHFQIFITSAHVINLDKQRDIDNYVHRIGKTGRAGKSGLATVSLILRFQALLNKFRSLWKKFIRKHQAGLIGQSWNKGQDIERTKLKQRSKQRYSQGGVCWYTVCLYFVFIMNEDTRPLQSIIWPKKERQRLEERRLKTQDKDAAKGEFVDTPFVSTLSLLWTKTQDLYKAPFDGSKDVKDLKL